LKDQQTHLSELNISEIEKNTTNLNKKLNDFEKEKIQIENKIQNEKIHFLKLMKIFKIIRRKLKDLLKK
jgi:hypothetical protein